MQNQQNDVCPAKTQISLGIRSIWLESLLCAHWEPSASSCGQQILWSVFSGRTGYFVGFVLLWLISRYHLTWGTIISTKWHVHPAKTEISLCICPVWSVFSDHVRKLWVLYAGFALLVAIVAKCKEKYFWYKKYQLAKTSGEKKFSSQKIVVFISPIWASLCHLIAN